MQPDARQQCVAGCTPACFSKTGGPRENPAKRFSWGEDEHRNERAFGVSRKRGIWRLRGRGPAPNASTESFPRSLLLGPPYHKQIRHTVPFCAQAPFPLDRARPVSFSAQPKRKWGVHPPSPWSGDIPHFSSNTDTYTVPTTSNPSLALT